MSFLSENGGGNMAKKQAATDPKMENMQITPQMLAANNYPKAGMYLAAIGGLLLLAEGIVCIFFRSLYYGINIDFLAGLGSVIIGILLVLDGLIVSGAALTLVMKPELRQAAGASIIIFSLLGLLLGGGWFIGSIMGFIGGLLAITWKPAKA
jgi:hypothetical protein